MDLNLTAYFLLAQVIGTRMLERRRGSIINVGSINGTVAFPQRLAYCVSKAGVNMLTKVLAIEWAASGVRVNCLAPGSVETPFIQGLAAQGILDTQKLPSARRWAGSARPTRWAPPPSSSPATSRRSSPARSSPPTAAGRHTGICRALARCERSFGVAGGLRDRLRVEAVDLADQLVGLRSLARALQQRGDMSGVWARIASLALAALLALAVGGVVSAHARTLGEFIDDARISAEITTRLTAESPSNFLKIDVKTESGIVTLSGTVDSYEKRSRAAQLAGGVNGVNGVKGLVNNIQVAGTAPPPSSPPGSGTSSTSSVDATGTVASVDAPPDDHAERRPRAPRHRPHRGVSADDRAGAQARRPRARPRRHARHRATARVAHGDRESCGRREAPARAHRRQRRARPVLGQRAPRLGAPDAGPDRAGRRGRDPAGARAVGLARHDGVAARRHDGRARRHGHQHRLDAVGRHPLTTRGGQERSTSTSSCISTSDT